ncbi:hypothetical protein [Streptomyces carpinensis]|uniref:Uncharacterized protein n=1 Tax=Streptomyces carpinensis TaxID=66369 RepID=A0ABV1W7J6_9ACTN|nr:hypothetical protein [Streptomyces carpinensis]
MTAVCPGPCNNAWRNAEAAGQPHDIPATWGQPIHCLRCANRAHSQLAELPELVVAIGLEAVHGTAPRSSGTIGRTATPCWPGQASRLLTDHIVEGLLGLEDAIPAVRRLPGRAARGREGADVTASVTFLRAHLGWALDRYPGETDSISGETMDPAALIRRWHRTAERFTRRDPRLEHHRVPCPRCDMLTLFRADDDDYIGCRNLACEVLLAPSEFEEHTQRLARKYDLAKAA